MNPQAWPLGRVRGVTLRDNFGDPRSGGRSHRGVDIVAPEGTPIRAATAGRVARSTRGGAPTPIEGHYVVIVDGDGWHHVYAHMRGEPLVSQGAQVTVGQPLGEVGTTGDSTGPHLHYGVSVGPGRDAQAIDVHDPLNTLLQASRRGTMDDAEFNSRLRGAQGWTRAFRVPRAWWEGNEERQAAARALREESTRQVLAAVAAARRARAEGTPEGIQRSERIVREIARFTGWTQTYSESLASQDAAVPAVQRAFVSALSSLAESVATGAQAIYEATTEAASSWLDDLFRDHGGKIAIAVGIGVAFYAMQRNNRAPRYVTRGAA